MKEKRTCRKCGEEFEEEIYELSKEAREVVQEIRKIMPAGMLEILESGVQKIYRQVDGLCERCQKQAIESMKLPSEKINKQDLAPWLYQI